MANSPRQMVRGLVNDLQGKSSDNRLERNIRLNVYHGILNMTAANMVQPFISIFAMKMMASDQQVALLSSAPAIVSLLAMIPGGKYADAQPEKKRITSLFFLMHRFFWVLMAMIPFFSTDIRATLLVGIVALMNLPGAMSNVAWQGFIGGVVPQQRRADAFAARNRAMNIAGTAMVLIAGRILDMMSFPIGYQIMFSSAFLLALGEIWVFRRIEETPPENFVKSEVPFWRGFGRSFVNDVREIWRNHRFLRYMGVSILFYFAWQVPWPLFSIYQFRELHANNMWISILNLTNTGGSLVGYGFWARYMNKNGTFNTLFASTIGIFIVPLAYAFSKNLYMIAFFNLLTGAIFSGVNLALFNALLEVTPDGRRTTYIAYYTTVVNFATIFAPITGVALLNLMGFKWAFLACALLRLLGSLTFLLISRLEGRERRAATDGATA